jgi:AraC-like DNA-binding protein/quercetin dioxygenase-like cupin family protein
MAETITTIIETITFPDGTHHHLIPMQNPACHPLREASICLAGLTFGPEGYVVQRRVPPIHEFLYVLSGSGIFEFPDHAAPLRKGDLLVLPAQSSYRYRTSKEGWRIMWFHLLNRGKWLMLDKPEPHIREAIVGEELCHVMEGLLKESIRDDVESSRLLTLYSEQIALYLSREIAASDSAHDRRMRQLLHDLWNSVNAQLRLEWNIASMAAKLNMSQAHFHRVCLRYSGCAPKQMLFRLRMQRAEELLVRYDYPLKNIAEELGYGTPFAFSNAFKRYEGVSPEYYRKQRGQILTGVTPL